ncbi:MAG TPA: peptidase M3A and M3B thimet/oligopeptidase F [Firmicutes bacterium]|jgi:peptidyl-dipeptidase A|nr:peptidase M3A and M3B thimet/oligopeptidase F [Bacillota bacterium]HAZ21897.1 peptidase M3A and M3B thimet/oligopeptidase F [Bacillota bacterium]HBE06117.1 peptidase M3A and M3B thimet/oligopeptidase F [Bacillota bacterium]HBG43020.1 peptidase M3A and M3B thimet/oligopeptidase F [Bacillota bacterium]HBL49236.1 peptidase M3A and M3B thimet/oligopeptidase F [Bacillota bacterium]
MEKGVTEKEFAAFLQEFEAQAIPLQIEMANARWLSQTTGRPEDFQKSGALSAKHMKMMSDRAAFQKLVQFRETGAVQEPLAARQLDMLYRNFLRNQVDDQTIAELVQRQTEISGDFVNFRTELNGEKVSDNVIRDILDEETDSAVRQQAWEASKKIGELVAEKVITLVKLRNRIARQLGFSDFYCMSLTLSELDVPEVFGIFDEFKKLSDQPFADAKKNLDRQLAQRFGIDMTQLRPWHYSDPFFQEAPKTGGVDLDSYYRGHNLEELAVRYYDGIGLEVRDILKRSDLYEREGKCQHAFCTDVDRQGDIRILANLRPDAKWMTTLLHELGHAVYDKYVDSNLPHRLRTAAHTLTTEAVAQLNGRMSQDAVFLHEIVGLERDEAQALAEKLQQNLQLSQLIFARWGMTVAYFERSMYSNPDQDLNRLWWDLVEEIQLLTRPEGRHQPDWAAKIHLANFPAYYQNYVLGEMTASQLWAHLTTKVMQAPSIVGQPAAGKFLIEQVFRPGARYHWNEMLQKATGEKLNPAHYLKQFVS